MRKQDVANWSDLGAGGIAHAIVSNVDLVVIRWPGGEGHSVLYGRCVHRGSLMADGSLVGDDIVCGVHNWDYRYETGVSAYKTSEKLHRFTSGVEDGQIWVDADDVEAWLTTHPQPYDRDSYQGAYQDHTGGPHEPHVAYIRELASNGLSGVGHHGAMGAMGVPFEQLPKWHDIQIVTAQLARSPLLDDASVATELVIGPKSGEAARARHPDHRERHELRRSLPGSESRLVAGCGDRGHGDLLGGRWDAP